MQDIARLKRVRKLIDGMKENFRSESRDQVFVRNALMFVEREGLPEEIAWLIVAASLLKEDRRRVEWGSSI
jgi:hypothetical protein